MMLRALLVLLMSLMSYTAWADDPQAPMPEVSNPDLDNSEIDDPEVGFPAQDESEIDDPEYTEPEVE